MEKVWIEFRLTVTGVAERIVGSRGRQQKKATACWNNELRDVVKHKKVLYSKALNVKTEEVWAKYRKANKEATRVVREAMGKADCRGTF